MSSGQHFAVTISFRVETELWEALEKLCAREERIVADVMRRLLREALVSRGLVRRARQEPRRR